MLRVSPGELEGAATSFDQACSALSGLQADAPLGDGAAAVAQLATGAACRAAQGDIAAAMTALADVTRQYSANLRTAVNRYTARDTAEAGAIVTAGL